MSDPSSPPPDAAPLAQRTAKAGAWLIGGRLLSRVLDLFSLLILARVLLPEDFGLVAMAMTVIVLIETVLEAPLNAVIIQEESPSDRLFNTMFTIGVFRCIGIAIIIALIAFPLSYIYNEPRLVPVMMVLSLSSFARGLANPRIATFVREFRYWPIFVQDVLGKLGALIVVTIVALTTQSYWAIVAGSIAGPAVACIVSYVVLPKRPGFSLSEWRRFQSALGWGSMTQLLMAINMQLDRVVLPKFISTADFGRYSLSQTIVSVPFTALVQPAMGPFMSAFTNTDQRGLDVVYVKALGAILVLVGPVLVMLAGLAGPLLHIAVGDQWAPAAPILSVLALTLILALPASPMQSMAYVRNRLDLQTAKTSAEFIVKLPLMIMLVQASGIEGALIAHASGSAVGFLAALVCARIMIGVSVMAQLAALAPPAIALTAMGLTLHFGLAFWQNGPLIAELFTLAVLASVAALIYGLTLFGAWSLVGRPNTFEFTLYKFLTERGGAVLARFQKVNSDAR